MNGSLVSSSAKRVNPRTRREGLSNTDAQTSYLTSTEIQPTPDLHEQQGERRLTAGEDTLLCNTQWKHINHSSPDWSVNTANIAKSSSDWSVNAANVAKSPDWPTHSVKGGDWPIQTASKMMIGPQDPETKATEDKDIYDCTALDLLTQNEVIQKHMNQRPPFNSELGKLTSLISNHF